MNIQRLACVVLVLALAACGSAPSAVSTASPTGLLTTAVAAVSGDTTPSAAPGPTVASTTAVLHSSPTIATTAAAIPAWGHRTKTSGCQVQGPFPDPACTPGDIFPTVTATQVCVVGYSSSVRDVSTSTKDQVYAEYGILHHSTGQYEVDHFVSLELGGSDDISNLFPEAADPKPGFHEKDLVENYLHEQVCYQHTLTLAQAQQAIAANWLAVYETMAGTSVDVPQATTAALATPAVQSTTAPAQSGGTTGFQLAQLTSPVARGGTATAKVQTAAGAACSLSYVTPHGTRSSAKGLGATTAGADGVCTWAWSIGSSTAPGTGTVTITVGGASQSFEIVVQ